MLSFFSYRYRRSNRRIILTCSCYDDIVTRLRRTIPLPKHAKLRMRLNAYVIRVVVVMIPLLAAIWILVMTTSSSCWLCLPKHRSFLSLEARASFPYYQSGEEQKHVVVDKFQPGPKLLCVQVRYWYSSSRRSGYHFGQRQARAGGSEVTSSLNQGVASVQSEEMLLILKIPTHD